MSEQTDKYEIALQTKVNITMQEVQGIQRKLDEACATLHGLREAQHLYSKHKPDAPELR